MALPAIRSAVTRDGVRIAFHTLGEGPAVVMLFPYHINHLELNWRVGLHRGGIEFFARYFTVINLDFRGAGLSERDVRGVSLESFAEDLDAVISALHLDRVALFAMGPAGLVACHFAARAPNRVSCLVFIESGESETNRRLLRLRDVSPQVEAQARGSLFGGLRDRHTAETLTDVTRDALTADAFEEWMRILDENELLPIAARVMAPALYLDVAGDDVVTQAAGQALVNVMPNARLMVVPGQSPLDAWRDRTAMQEVSQFIARGFGLDEELSRTQRRERRAGGDHPGGLSDREVEVLRLLTSGRTNQQIAEELFVSLNTVSHHLRNIYAKSGAANRTEAATFAHQHGLVH
jgi:DNA-binding CsgD family transcriptional regulator/pimeloyl-ACP methyl ester carboxylesterase